MKLITKLAVLSVSLVSLFANAKVTVSQPYAKATFAMAKTGAMYLTLENESSAPITLVDVKVTDDVADVAQIHTTILEDDVYKMRHLVDGVLLPVGERVEFVPGGKHIMLMGLAKPLTGGSEFAVELVFSDGKTQTIAVPVRKQEDTSNAHHHHH